MVRQAVRGESSDADVPRLSKKSSPSVIVLSKFVPVHGEPNEVMAVLSIGVAARNRSTGVPVTFTASVPSLCFPGAR